ncbi:MAG: YafY family transcriptional regulator [Anaerolineae bacterium]|nr:MAG: YafY family transcriptional regulator [Anaerolineae bacterium]
MYHPTTRLLTVLELLQAHPQLSGPEIAHRLEVDVRTVRRYIVMLQDLGIPIEGERGRHGAYRLRPGFKLPPMMFTDEEALGLTLGLLITRRLGLSIEAPAIEGALAKIERVLPDALREQVQAVQESLLIHLNIHHAAPASNLIVLFSTAVQQNRRVQLTYIAWNGEISTRPFDPYGLVMHGGFWYTVGYCHLRDDLRTFRLDRVTNAEVLTESFTPPANFDTVGQVMKGIASTPGTWRVEVILEMPIEQAVQQIPPYLGLMEAFGERVYLTIYTQKLDWVGNFLVGLNCEFQICNPPELRKVLQHLAAKITRIVEASEI